jgi:hypothetical protein
MQSCAESQAAAAPGHAAEPHNATAAAAAAVVHAFSCLSLPLWQLLLETVTVPLIGNQLGMHTAQQYPRLPKELHYIQIINAATAPA